MKNADVPVLMLSAIMAAASTYAYFRSKLGTDTIRLLQENKQAQGDRIKILEEDSELKSKQIAHLGGQIDVLKTVPLQRIDKNLTENGKRLSELTKEISSSSQKILDKLENQNAMD